MTNPPARIAEAVQEVIDPTDSPFPLEQLALDASNALRAAEIGLRGFRSRPLLRRLVNAFTGQGQQLQSAIGFDLVTTQRAALGIIQFSLAEQTRTNYCLNRVLHNLHAVDRDLDQVAAKVTTIDKNTRQLEGVANQIYRSLDELRTSIDTRFREQAEEFRGALVHEIASVQFQLAHRIEREEAVRRLRDAYLAGQLHPGMGELLGASVYVALVSRHYHDDEVAVDRERQSALHVIQQRLDHSRVEPLSDLLLRTASEVKQAELETVGYLVSASSSPALHAVRLLVERRAVGLRVDEQEAQEALQVTQHWHDPDQYLDRIRLPETRQWVLQLAGELTNCGEGA